MKPTVKLSTVDTLTELEQEMTAAQRTAVAEALREALAVLVRPSTGWLTSGQAAERLDITIPTVKDWVRRGTLKGRLVGSRWWVSEDSVAKVLGIREMLGEMEDEGYPTEEQIYELTKRVRHQMATEKKRKVG